MAIFNQGMLINSYMEGKVQKHWKYSSYLNRLQHLLHFSQKKNLNTANLQVLFSAHNAVQVARHAIALLRECGDLFFE